MVKININLFYHSLFHLVPFVLYWVQSTTGVRFQPWSLVWPLYLQVPVELGFLRLLNELWDRVALWSSLAKQTDVVMLVSSILGCQSVLRYFLDLKEGFFQCSNFFLLLSRFTHRVWLDSSFVASGFNNPQVLPSYLHFNLFFNFFKVLKSLNNI